MKPTVTIELLEYERLKTIEQGLIDTDKKVVINSSIAGLWHGRKDCVYFLSDEEFLGKLNNLKNINTKLEQELDTARDVLKKLSRCTGRQFRKWQKETSIPQYINQMASVQIGIDPGVPMDLFITNSIREL